MWKTSLTILSLVCLVVVSSLPYDPILNIKLKPLKSSDVRIREQGYPAESHFAETEDGYLLNLFRIPYSPKLKNKKKRKPVVFLQHGLLSCSDSYLLNGPDNALAFNFADAGFDVWLGNARGNTYSCQNKKISLNHPNFWKFSWHEIGAIDLPTMIDYVLQKTGEKSLHYVGHSQGTTVFFVMASWRSEYNIKIKSAHMLAPCAFMGNVSDSMVTGLAPYVGNPDSLYTKLISNQPFSPYNSLIQRILNTACGGKPKYPKYCKTLYLLWTGGEQSNINVTLLPKIAETHPAGVSTNQGIHYVQSYVSNKFRLYDHGTEDNKKIYGQETPPDYPLEKITAPMHLYFGLADNSASHKDVRRLPNYLPNIKDLHEVPDPTWSHTDFVFATQVKSVINDKIISSCLKYEKKKFNFWHSSKE